MGFQYHKSKQKVDESTQWSSYSDLFMMLAVVFLLMYVTSSVREGAFSIQKYQEYQQLAKEAETLRDQLRVYNTLKDDYLENQASEEENESYEELMAKLDLLQEENKKEASALRQQARENVDKANALNKYQSMIRNIINNNVISRARRNKKDEIIQKKDQVISQKEDTIVSDQLVHASIIDGIRLSKANKSIFKHNDIQDLELQLQDVDGQIFIVVESVYSMDGDLALLQKISQLAKKYEANLIVDEAHASGVFGQEGAGLVSELGLENEVFARVITYGKALGVHGAAILGSQLLRDYLINFCRPFIFSTGLPMHSIASIKAAYQLLPKSQEKRRQLQELIQLFKSEIADLGQSYSLIDSNSAVQSLIIPGPNQAKEIAAYLEKQGFYAKAIVYPTVAKGQERIRFCLHSFNQKQEVLSLINSIKLAESLSTTSG